jgi:hypothetical protein
VDDGDDGMAPGDDLSRKKPRSSFKGVARKKPLLRPARADDDDDYEEVEKKADAGCDEEDSEGDSGEVEEEREGEGEEEGKGKGEEEDEEEDEEEGEEQEEKERADDDEVASLPLSEKKKVAKERKVGEKKKRSLQHSLWVTVNKERHLVKCRLCNLEQKFHLSNCKTHWRDKHRKEFEIINLANERGDDVEATFKTIMETKRQNGVVGFFRNSPAAVASSNGSKAEITGRVRKELALLYHMICTKQSFNSTADESFVVLKKEWGVQLEETSKIFQLIEPMFVTAVRMKEEELMKCGAVSTTIDFWTSAAKRKYLAITYHGITPDWQMSHHLLDLVHFPGTTFAELIGLCLADRIEQHLPGNTMSVATVSDRGGDVKKACNLEINEDGEDCMNHRLNSVINDVFGDSAKARQHKGLLGVVMVQAVNYLISLIESDRNCKLLLHHLQEQEDYDAVLQFVTKKRHALGGPSDDAGTIRAFENGTDVRLW